MKDWTEREKKKYAVQSDDLTGAWNDLNEKYVDLEPISFNEFKELFLKTFRYFYETANTETIFRYDALLIKEMSIFYAIEDCPRQGMSLLEDGVCKILIDGLIYSVARNAVILEKVGIIMVEISMGGGRIELKLNDFENSLKKVMDAYAEENGIDYDD